MSDESTIEEQAPAAPAYALHSVAAVVWAAFVGSFVAAGIVMAINYARLGRPTAARVTILVSVLATAALITIVMSIPEDAELPNVLFIATQLVLTWLVAGSLQRDSIRSHDALGGKIASGWAAVGIGFLCGIVLLAIILAVAFAIDASYGTLIRFGEDEVYYAGDATEADARKLGEELQKIAYFTGEGVSVRIEGAPGHQEISFVLIQDAWNDEANVAYYRQVGNLLAMAGFKPLTVHLCDQYLDRQKTFEIR